MSRFQLLVTAAVILASLSACGSGDSGGGGNGGSAGSSAAGAGGSGGAGLPSCADSQVAVVTDIDETLTISDSEFFPMQTSDGNYDPKEREGGSALMNGYADHGYFVVYLTARPENLTVQVTNETARQATDRWLMEHGYPLERSRLVLSDQLVVDEAARQYKAAALTDLKGEGFSFDYAYGNAESDVHAYADAGIAKEDTFIIGAKAGLEGTVAVAGETWTDHAAQQLPKVRQVCSTE